MSLSSCRAMALLAAAITLTSAGAARSAAPPARCVTTTSQGRLTLGVVVNSDSGLTGSVVLNERNFDIGQNNERPITIPAAAATSAVVVSDVIIQGNRLVSTEAIRNMMKTRPGKQFVADTVMEDVRALYKSGQFGNVYADKKEDGPGRVKVYVYVKGSPNAIEKITFQGNRHFSHDELMEIIGLRAGKPLHPIVNKVACHRIVYEYNEAGRPFAACDLVKGADPNDTEVVFKINEGPRTRVASVSFTGNVFFSSAELTKHVNVSHSEFLNELEVAAFYRSCGFQDVKVARELKFSHDGQQVDVVFHVVEGLCYRSAETPPPLGVKSAAAEALEAMDKVKTGETDKNADVDGDVRSIRDNFGFQGRDVSVIAVPTVDPDSPGVIRVQYEVVEAEPARLGRIIVGEERPRQAGANSTEMAKQAAAVRGVLLFW